MRAYKCDICGILFDNRVVPTLPKALSDLLIACPSLNGYGADLCPECLSRLRNTVYDLIPRAEESNESETSSSECEDILE